MQCRNEQRTSCSIVCECQIDELTKDKDPDELRRWEAGFADTEQRAARTKEIGAAEAACLKRLSLQLR